MSNLHIPDGSAEHQQYSQLTAQGDVIRVAPGIYMDATAEFERVFNQEFGRLLHALTGDSFRLSHRSALSPTPTSQIICVTVPDRSAAEEKHIKSKTILLLDGPEDPEEEKLEWASESIPRSSVELALAECTQDRRGAYRSAILDREELEEQIYHHQDQIDPDRLQSMVGFVPKPSDRTEKLLDIYEAIRSKTVEGLVNDTIRQKVTSQGADPGRVELFSNLADFLKDQPAPSNDQVPKRPWSIDDPEQYTNFCFLASYFSNYVEGTEFPPEEAQAIVRKGSFPGVPPDERTLASTYETYRELKDHVPPPLGEPDEFMEWLKSIHEELAGGNESLRPGEFKQKQNRAGQFYFVEPEKVEPTLRAGLADSNSIDHPFYLALHVFFVVNEVHPFKDGNGRAARLLQDKILLDHGYSGLFVTTLNRDFYLKTLRDTSLREDEGWARTYTENLMQIYRRNYDPPLRSEDQLIEYARLESDDSLDDDSIQERIESIEEEDPGNSDGSSP